MIAQAEAIDTLEVDLPGFAKEIRELHRQTTIEGIFAIGERLDIANQELSRKGNGTFISWVESNLPFTRKTAGNYIAAYRAFTKEEWESLSHSCTAEALYALARKPEAVREEAIELANDGERIDLATVKELSGESPKDDKPLTMPRAMLRLQRVLRNIVEWFPKEHREALGNRMIAAGDEILTTGGIR